MVIILINDLETVRKRPKLNLLTRQTPDYELQEEDNGTTLSLLFNFYHFFVVVGMVKVGLPHLLWQPGSLMLLRLLMLAATSENGRPDTHMTRKTTYITLVASRGKND